MSRNANIVIVNIKITNILIVFRSIQKLGPIICDRYKKSAVYFPDVIQDIAGIGVQHFPAVHLWNWNAKHRMERIVSYPYMAYSEFHNATMQEDSKNVSSQQHSHDGVER